MAGLNAGTTNWGSFRGSPETVIPKPPQPEQSQRMNRGNFRNFQGRGNRGGIDTAPKPFSGPAGGGGINTGRTSNMGITPSPMDPFRTYGSVGGGRMTPPQNPYGQNQPIRFTPGGEYGGGGGGPINTGPSPNVPYMPQIVPDSTPQDWINRGGFTGWGGTNTLPGRTPPGMPTNENPGIWNPPPPVPGQPYFGYEGDNSVIPNMPQGMNRPSRGGLGSMYSGAGPSLSGGRNRGGLFY